MKWIPLTAVLALALPGCQAPTPKPPPAPLVVPDMAAVIHSWSGMAFPQQVGALVRNDPPMRFDESGRDFGVGYQLRSKERSLTTTVFIYPTPGTQPPDGGNATAPDEAIARTMLCSHELESRKRELLRFHPESVLSEAKPVSLIQNGTAHAGYHVAFNSVEQYAGYPQNVSSDFFLFCFAKDDWTIAYRFTFPMSPGRSTISCARWPGRARTPAHSPLADTRNVVAAVRLECQGLAHLRQPGTCNPKPPQSIAHLLLAVLPALLRVETQRRDRARFEAIQADFLVGLLAEAVASFLDALERLVDLGDQLAIAIARAQLERILGLARGALRLVADIAHFIAQVVDRLLGLLDQVFAPLLQLGAEVGELTRAHVFLTLRRVVTGRQIDDDRARQSVATVVA